MTLCLHGWWSWHPPVGVWIGVLGLVGILVPLFREPKAMKKFEKALWTLLMFAFLILELHSVYQDRCEHDKEQAEARALSERNFQGIANGIETEINKSRENFTATMQQFTGVTNSQKKMRAEFLKKLESLSQQQLHNMTNKDLASKAGDAAVQMRQLVDSYKYQYDQASRSYDDARIGDAHNFPPKVLEKLHLRMEQITKDYESEAERLANSVTLICAEMQSRLESDKKGPVDKEWNDWFAHPTPASGLDKLPDAADYLNRLAGRISQQ